MQTIADIIRTCLGPKAMLKVSLAYSLLSYIVNPGFSIRIGVGGKTSRVGSEGTTRAKGMILGWGCVGVCPGDS